MKLLKTILIFAVPILMIVVFVGVFVNGQENFEYRGFAYIADKLSNSPVFGYSIDNIKEIFGYVTSFPKVFTQGDFLDIFMALSSIWLMWWKFLMIPVYAVADIINILWWVLTGLLGFQV